MKLEIFQIDTFTDQIFGGNPAAVVPIERWLDQEVMQQIATENNLSETAFILNEGSVFAIRWFTPTNEVALCGHAMLGAAHVLFKHLGYSGSTCHFRTAKRGMISVEKSNKGYAMDLPSDQPSPIDAAEKSKVAKALNHPLVDCVKGSDDYLAVFQTKELVRDHQPNFSAIQKLPCRGIIISSKDGGQFDFVSRCFYPAYGINEDPVTGSAHTLLVPYWSKVLRKNRLMGLQQSARIGRLECINQGDRVILGGSARTYMKGQICIPDGL